jgi:hypothetical protein
MTHDDARSAKAPFSGLLPFAVSRYSFLAVAKSAAGRENPSYSWRHQTRHASFCVYAHVHPFLRMVLKPLLYLRNGGSGGAAFGLAGTH